MTKPTTARTCIVEAFLQLCQTLPCDKITVSQLTKKAGKPRVIDRKQIIYCPGNIYSFFMLVRAIFTVPGIYLPLGQRYYMVMKERGEEK